MKIAIFGAPGSFTEEAALSYCSKRPIRPSFSHHETAEEVFDAVERNHASLGVIPLSNSIGGSVEETVEAMSKHSFDNVNVLELQIRQNLLSLKGIDLPAINGIVSHPQALAQSRLYLARNWLKTEKKPYSSTAKAAQDLSEGKLSPRIAVIASGRAAKMYGLHIIAQDIQDTSTNFTQFLVFKKHGSKNIVIHLMRNLLRKA